MLGGMRAASYNVVFTCRLLIGGVYYVYSCLVGGDAATTSTIANHSSYVYTM